MLNPCTLEYRDGIYICACGKQSKVKCKIGPCGLNKTFQRMEEPVRTNLCTFVMQHETKKGYKLWQCENCERKVYAKEEPSAKCRLNKLETCAHRGEIVDKIECTVCGQKKLVNVYTCDLKEKCTLRKHKTGALNRLADCTSCELYEMRIPQSEMQEMQQEDSMEQES